MAMTGIDEDPIAAPRVFTSGQVAKMCRVAPRTVSKWFDAGRFKGAYKIPGSLDRRIPIAGLIEFLVANKMPFPPGITPGGAAAVDCEVPIPGFAPLDPFGCLAAVLRSEVGVVVVGCADGLRRACGLAREIRKRAPWVRLALLIGPDTDPREVPDDLKKLVAAGADPDLIAASAISECELATNSEED